MEKTCVICLEKTVFSRERCKRCYSYFKRNNKERPPRIFLYTQGIIENQKICSKCRKFKDLSCFNRKRTARSGYQYCCKECRSLERHLISNICSLCAKDRFNCYAGGICGTCALRIKRRENIKNPIYIHRILKDKQYTKNIVVCQKSEFVQWYNQINKKCDYCQIQEKELETDTLLPFRITRKRLTIDRKDPKKGYIIDNIVLACGYCNALKSNLFTYDEMKMIGDIIRKKREERLKNK